VTVSLKHAFTSNVADSGDATLVQPSNWNAEHNLTANANSLLGTVTAGSVTEISCTSAGRDLLDDADASAQRTTLGVGTGDSPQFAGINVGNATDTTITRVSAGVIAVEGNQVPSPGSVAQGDIIYYGGSTWDRLGAGTSGQLLKTNGVGANPSWSDPVIPSGSVMLFQQTAAPTGWTKLTTHNNKALRVVSGTASSGGTVDFTTAFASQSVSGTISGTTASGTVGSTTLTTAQMPSHNHTYTAGTGPVTATGASIRLNNLTSTDLSNNTGSTGGGGSHSHSFTGISHTHTFTGTAIDLAVQYVDIILASKD
jgi:hypothetical protein